MICFFCSCIYNRLIRLQRSKRSKRTTDFNNEFFDTDSDSDVSDCSADTPVENIEGYKPFAPS